MENLSTFVRTLGNQFIKGKKVFVNAIKIEGVLIDGTSDVGTSGQVLSTTGTGVEWITVGSSDVGELNDLTDVIISTASTGQLLSFDGESWVNWTHDFLTTSATLSSLTDVGNLNPTDQQILRYNSGTGLWITDDMPEIDEVDTLDSVTGRGDTTTNNISVGNVTSTKIVAPIMEHNGKLVIKSTYQMDQGETDFTFLGFNFANIDVVTINDEGYVTGAGFKTSGTTGFLRSDGSVDTSTYLTSYTESQSLDDVTTLGGSTTNSIIVGGVQAPTHSSSGAMNITADTNSNIQLEEDGTEKLISFNWGTTEVGYIDTDSKITFNGFKTPAGTSSGFLKADGSIDTTTYLSGLPQRDLTSLSDVKISNPEGGDFLVYDESSSEWVNSTISLEETDTLDDVTGRGNTTTNSIDVGGVTTDYVQFDTAVTLAGDEVQGYMAWNADVDTVSVYPYDSQWFNIGQDMHWHVKNGTDEVIARGTVVMATGTVGNSSKVEAGLMVSDGTVNSKYIIGVALRDIAAGEFGKVVTQGTIRGIDTQLFQEGDVLWCDPQNDGGLTNVEPSAPNLRLPIAFVVSSADNGAIAVRITQGNVLHELHDVSAASPSDGDLLGYNSTDGIWENFTPDYAASNHDHDDRYYTETEVDTLLSGKSDADHGHDRATTELDGFMSASDKEKLDGIEDNANNYSLPIAGTSLGGVKSGADISVDESGNVSVLDDSHTHDGRYYTETESDDRYARGVTINYSSVDNDPEEDAWYKLFQITDSGSSPVICFLRGYAHSSVTFIVSEGYLGSNAHVQILDYLTSTNNNYKWIKGVRIISNGDVEVLLNGGPNVSLEMSIIGDAVYLNQPRLSTALAADVRDSVTGLTNGMIRAKGDVTGANLNISNWNTAYGWGNHAGLYADLSHTHEIQDITELQDALDRKIESETDPIYTGSSWYTTSNNATNWDAAYGWGNHAGLYAEIDHTHEIADVNELQDILDRKLESESDTLSTVTARGATTSEALSLGTDSATGGALVITDRYSGDDHLASIGFLRSSGGTYIGYGVKQDGSADWKSTFDNFSGKRNYLAIDEDSIRIAYAAAQQTTVGAAVTLSEKFRFDLAEGRLGIGTTSPSYKLDVAGEIRLNSGNSFTDLNIKSDRTSGNIGGVNFVNASDEIKGQVYGNTDGSVRITTGGTTLAMFIDSSQNVGIGTTSPSYKLDVDATSIRPTANLLLGEAAYSVSADYVGLKTTFMSGSNDYMILSGKSDGSTYVSAKNGDSVYIRGGGNLSSNQIVVPDGNYINIDTTTLNVSGGVSVGSNIVVQYGAGIYSIKSIIDTSASETAFRISNTNGVQAARATFVAETDTYKVAKIYEVVHAGDGEPVAFKVVDTGPSGEDDFSVAFTNDGGDLLCTVTNDSANESLTLVTTIFVGGSNSSQTVSNS